MTCYDWRSAQRQDLRERCVGKLRDIDENAKIVKPLHGFTSQGREATIFIDMIAALQGGTRGIGELIIAGVHEADDCHAAFVPFVEGVEIVTQWPGIE